MKNLWLYLLVLLIGGPLLIAEFRGCKVSGEEFSPDDFTARTFSYRRSPFSGTLRSGRLNVEYEFQCTAIIDEGHISVVKSTPKRWDLFREDMQYTNRLSSEFDSRFLTHFLNYNSQQWSLDQPEKAAVLWPEVAKMARRGLYLHLPEVMIAAVPKNYGYIEEDDRSLEEFKDQMRAKFADAYRKAAEVAKANKDGKEDQWLTAAAECQSDSFGEKEDVASVEVEAEDPNQSVEP